MQQKSLGASLRRQVSRKLGCERLEQRALLTGLIGAAEIAPLPVEEFKAQADSFVTSALDHVLATQNQKPVTFSKEQSIAVTEDGRPARVTYYTVELDTSRPSATNSLIQLDGNGKTTPVAISGDTTRSNLVFSFLVHADNSVSIRAKLYNPPNWIGFSPSNFELHERLRARQSMAENSQLSTLSPGNVASEVAETANGPQLVQGPSKTSENAADDLYSDAEQAEPTDADADSSGPSFDTLASEMFWLEFEGSQVAEAEVREDNLVEVANLAQRASGQSEVDYETHLAIEPSSAGLPIPAGMIPLDFATEAALRQTIASVPASSAIYQVFVHAADASDLATDPRSEPQPSQPSPEQAPPVEQSTPSRWRGTTVAMASLLGGLAWGRRARRDDSAAAR